MWKYRKVTKCSMTGVTTMCVSVDGQYFFSNKVAGYAARMYNQGIHPVTKQPLYSRPSTSPTTQNKEIPDENE